MQVQVTLLYIVLAGFIFAYISPPISMSQDYFFWVVFVITVCLFVFLVPPGKDKVLKKRFLKHSNLFLISLLIVNFQYPVDYILGYSITSDAEVWVNERIASKSLLISSIGLVSFLIGYILFTSSTKKIKSASADSTIHSSFFLKTLAVCSLLSYFATVNPLYIYGGYATGAEMGGTAQFISLLFESLVAAIVIQTSRNLILMRQHSLQLITIKRYLHEIGYFSLLLILVYLLSVILSGDRGPIISLALILIGGYLGASKKRINLVILLVVITLSATFMSLQGIARRYDTNLSFLEKMEMAYNHRNDTVETKTISSSTKELAGSINTLHYAVNYVPEEHPFIYGKFQFHELISAIPFAAGLYFASWDESQTPQLSSPYFITWIAQGDNPSYGNGSSIIADFYLAAGLLGVISGMLFTSWLIKRSEYVMYDDNLAPLFWHVFSLVYFSRMIYLGRTSLLSSLKVVVIVYVLIYINRYLSFKKVNTLYIQ